MRVVELRAEIGANDYRLDTGNTLLWPRESPNGIDASVRGATNSRGGHLAGAEQQIGVDLLERLPRIRIEERDGCNEEALLVSARACTTVSSIAQIGEVPQERRRGRGRGRS